MMMMMMMMASQAQSMYHLQIMQNGGNYCVMIVIVLFAKVIAHFFLDYLALTFELGSPDLES